MMAENQPGRRIVALTSDDVARLASLARIELTPEERERLTPELDVILTSVQQVAHVVDDSIPMMTHAMPLVNVMRQDEVRPSLSQDEVLAGAPASEDGRFRVPQILSED